MTKICLLGDLHFGFRVYNEVVVAHYKRFFDEIFFPYLIENDIKTVFQLGDLMEDRRTINVQTLEFMTEVFLKPLEENNIQLHTILGNHDVFWKNKNSLNSVQYIVAPYKNITLHQDIEEVSIDNHIFTFVPWLTDFHNTKERFLNYLEEHTADIILGHFDIATFEYIKGVVSKKGLDPKLFNKYPNIKKVFSGHFHLHSKCGKVHYIGTPYEYTFNDLNDEKGFFVLDTETLELERVVNPYKLFHQLNYDDTEYNYDSLDFSIYKDTYVRVNVLTITSEKMYYRFLDSIYGSDAIEVSVSEIDLLIGEQDVTEVENTDTLTIIQETVSLVEDIDNDKILGILNELYSEALILRE